MSEPVVVLAWLVVALVVQIVRDAEAVTGGFVHLLRGVDGVLQLGDAVFHLRQFLLDFFFEILHFLLGHLQGAFVELSLLLGQNRHGRKPPIPLGHVRADRREDYSLNGMVRVLNDFTLIPFLVAGENVER